LLSGLERPVTGECGKYPRARSHVIFGEGRVVMGKANSWASPSPAARVDMDEVYSTLKNMREGAHRLRAHYG
jgi:hypothetical protein